MESVYHIVAICVNETSWEHVCRLHSRYLGTGYGTKQNVIKRARLKFIKISIFQNKAFASKRPKMRDGRLASKMKLKRSQMQNRVQEDLIRNIACSADGISPKSSRSSMLIGHHPSHLN
jgi:hypothetical protein